MEHNNSSDGAYWQRHESGDATTECSRKTLVFNTGRRQDCGY